MHKRLLLLLAIVALLVLATVPNIIYAAPDSDSVPVRTHGLKNMLLFLRDGDIWIHDVEIKKEIRLTNEVVYYEVIIDPDGNGLIRSHNVQTNKTEDVVKDASVPRFVR